MMGMKLTCVACADRARQQASDRGLDKTLASHSRTQSVGFVGFSYIKNLNCLIRQEMTVHFIVLSDKTCCMSERWEENFRTSALRTVL